MTAPVACDLAIAPTVFLTPAPSRLPPRRLAQGRPGSSPKGTHEVSFDVNGAVHCAGHGWHLYVLGIASLSRAFLCFVRT